MLKKLVLTLGVLTVGVTAASASPLTLTVASGGWSNAAGPAGICADIDNAPGQAQDEIRWNGEDLLSFPDTNQYTTQGDACGLVDPVSGPYLTSVSGYNFDPTNGVMSVLPGTSSTFSLGTFQHINEPISDAITSVDYQLNVDNNSSNQANPLSLNMTFLHNETDNIPTADDPTCCADIVTVLLPSITTYFKVGNDLFQFTLLGFSPTGANGSFNNVFSSPENGTNTTQLWAQVSPVPEPATLTLLGSGLVGLGTVARRRFRRSKVQA